jgi:hypothetical protein
VLPPGSSLRRDGVLSGAGCEAHRV